MGTATDSLPVIALELAGWTRFFVTFSPVARGWPVVSPRPAAFSPRADEKVTGDSSGLHVQKLLTPAVARPSSPS